jgi:hypothetical protein
MLIVPLLLATLLYAVLGSLALALVAALAGVALAALWQRMIGSRR